MHQTYISAYGKVIIENGILYVKNLKPVLTFSRFAYIAFRITIILRFVFLFFEDNTPKRNTGLVLFGFLSLFYGIELAFLSFKAVFQQSLAKRIPLRSIRSFRLQEDTNELEIHFYLKLHSGKERKLTFRKLEKQYEVLADALSQYLASPKFA